MTAHHALPVYLTNPWPFRDIHHGRSFHARHLSAQRRHGYLASSLCGINLASGVESLDDDFPPPGNHRACAKCLDLSCPEGLPQRAFELLGKIASMTARNMNVAVVTQLYRRDLIESYATPNLTSLGWRWLDFCRKHPAFDKELMR